MPITPPPVETPKLESLCLFPVLRRPAITGGWPVAFGGRGTSLRDTRQPRSERFADVLHRAALRRGHFHHSPFTFFQAGIESLLGRLRWPATPVRLVVGPAGGRASSTSTRTNSAAFLLNLFMPASFLTLCDTPNTFSKPFHERETGKAPASAAQQEHAHGLAQVVMYQLLFQILQCPDPGVIDLHDKVATLHPAPEGLRIAPQPRAARTVSCSPQDPAWHPSGPFPGGTSLHAAHRNLRLFARQSQGRQTSPVEFPVLQVPSAYLRSCSSPLPCPRSCSVPPSRPRRCTSQPQGGGISSRSARSLSARERWDADSTALIR